MFNKVIVKVPPESMINGISSNQDEKPIYSKALKQHEEYVKALGRCNVSMISRLAKQEKYPDSCFVEDTAVVTEKCAVITNPGTKSRKGEIGEVESELKKYYNSIEYIKKPGTLDGGDVMRVDNHFYIGLSKRTNEEGAEQLINILNKYGYSGSQIKVKNYLHLKTGISYLKNNNILATKDFVNHPAFKSFNLLEVPGNEEYAANSIWVNNKVIMPGGYPETKKLVEDAGYEVLTVDVSEFRKLDGGVSCLSIRF
ncbi:MAG: N(G),N(G)-dimethylarginine dimethylaminohydrolase [Candidatus Mcinerneyibacterium aminivorans]|uniref:N(G),N(G)-dimethylarginine dimethylaminohydrolase n=1 Tax=Candidatus Mcinerneyibacterium aminivorans TaxID=2703815 RepID=A0A5D0MCB3_9BACT|nr:MAG: N(G),N(G)-dimethylarginine dimethylaminohydrolase [Candidatus Mcinerneyibacterium aminivorans]